jgi:Carboxypeptidase regulatory-like domain
MKQMAFRASSLLLGVLLGTSMFGQSVVQPTQPQTFHIRGMIKDASGAVIPKVKVAFESKQVERTVTTNDVGVYDSDLPLGDYTMTAEIFGFRPYRRPLFRVKSPTSLEFDIILSVQPTCDIVVVGASGHTATPQEWAAAKKELCLHEEFLPSPSNEGAPFQLYFRYEHRTLADNIYAYKGEKNTREPVFVAYNLFSLQADEVIYDAKNRIINASGSVVVVDESGATQYGDSMNFKIENGEAILLP